LSNPVSTEGEQQMTTGRPLRADAQRNHDAIVAAAAAELAHSGANASLEEIARKAGVGSATLHRRFPTRRDLVQAVFADQIRTLCDRAVPLSAEHPPDAALREWLGEVAAYSARTRGMADAVRFGDDTPTNGSCEAALASTATALLRSAQAAGTVHGNVTALTLLALVNGISLAAQEHADPAETATTLTDLAFHGIAPQQPTRPQLSAPTTLTTTSAVAAGTAGQGVR
jgi:AcrR family transcriptional regulator